MDNKGKGAALRCFPLLGFKMAGFYLLTRIPAKKIANHAVLECGRSHLNELDESVGMWHTGATGPSESQQSPTACRNSDATGHHPPLQSNKVRLILKITNQYHYLLETAACDCSLSGSTGVSAGCFSSSRFHLHAAVDRLQTG